MAIFRVEKAKDYTVMSNYHLKDKKLSLKAKGLLSLMLSLPEDWDYTAKGLVKISKDGIDSVNSALNELEDNKYLIRFKIRDKKGRLVDVEYIVFEKPTQEKPVLENPITENPVLEKPITENPILENPVLGKPILENPVQLNTKEMIERENEKAHVREKILENINFDLLAKNYELNLLNEVVDVMVDTMTTKKPYLPIGKDNRIANQDLKIQFEKYDYDVLGYVLSRLERVDDTTIQNRQSYIRTALYNAPRTMAEQATSKNEICDKATTNNNTRKNDRKYDSSYIRQKHNYTQREYSDEFLNSLFTDLTSPKKVETFKPRNMCNYTQREYDDEFYDNLSVDLTKTV